MLEIRYCSAAARRVQAAPAHLQRRILARVQELAENPFPSGVRRVVNGPEKEFRVRVGTWRIRYVLLPHEGVVLITRIEQRSHVYD